MVSSTTSAIGQQTYRPPVHISPNQQYNASQRYTGIAALETEPAPQAVQAEQNQVAKAQGPPKNTSPHLQARIANAFGNLSSKNRKPKRSRGSQSRKNQQPILPTPLYNSQNQYANSAFVSEEQRLQQEYIPRLVRDQSLQQPLTGRAPVSHRPQPVGQVVQRREQPNRYPVQPIQSGQDTGSVDRFIELDGEFARVGAAPDPYYDPPNIRVTSAQEFAEETAQEVEPPRPPLRTVRTVREEPVEPVVQVEPIERVERVEQVADRFAQTPVYRPVRQKPVPRTRPVSILRSPANEAANVDPGFGIQDEEEDTPEVENELRSTFEEIEEPEEEELDDEDLDPVDEELPERERQEIDQNCNEMRYEMLVNPITDIAVDISPPRSELSSPAGAEFRTWTDQFGRTTGSGAVSTVRRGYALVQSGGAWQKVPVGNMSDADLAALSSYWQLPKECTVSTDSFTGRSWIPQTVTWKASNLCHKPLFFENVQLERYGHSHGPFAQPIQSTVHFFTSLASVPYNMGITPANECQYALGFYRPGNCAPWLKEPFPISLSGARTSAAASLVGAFLFFP